MKITPIVIMLILSAMFIAGCNTQEKDLLSINLQEHKNLALHIHPEIEIIINGEKQTMPTNIGIGGEGMRVMHTHDSTGKIHIESPTPQQFYLGDFFKIWGRVFNATCILDQCIDENHRIKVLLNGKEDTRFEAIPLKDHDKVTIIYERKS